MFAVRRKLWPARPARVAHRLGLPLACGDIPQVDCPGMLLRRDQCLPVGRECNPLRVRSFALAPAPFPPGGHVPEVDVSKTSGGERLAIRREEDCEYVFLILGQIA